MSKFFIAKTASDVSGAVAAALLYSEVVKDSTNIVVGTALISAIAHGILRYMIYSLSPSKQTRRNYHAGANFFVNAVSICALAYFDIIATKGVCLLAFVAICNAAAISEGRSRQPA